MSESIYNLVPREYIAPEKPPMYRSHHNPDGPLTGSTFGCKGTTRLVGAGMAEKKDGALFGPRDSTARPDPKTFLRKTAKEVVSPSRPFHYTDRNRPPLPDRDDRPVMGIRSNKNFITANAVEAILQVPRVINLEEPNYRNKEDYGKIPAYLSQVKEEIQREKEMIDTYVKEKMGIEEREPEYLEEIDDIERHQILDALKAKWDVVNKRYQKMAHVVQLDTIGMVRRKEGMEKELKQLEYDIEKLQEPGPLLVR
jgi:hypothetical protein